VILQTFAYFVNSNQISRYGFRIFIMVIRTLLGVINLDFISGEIALVNVDLGEWCRLTQNLPNPTQNLTSCPNNFAG
jgi:hypothetical protein